VSLAKYEAWAIGGAVVLGLYVLYKGGKVLGGIVSNDNALTRSATDASGNKVTAYQDTTIPLLGTLAAIFNAASDGTLASIGEAGASVAADVTTSDTGGVAPIAVNPGSSKDINGDSVSEWQYVGGA
jgi:hypothetical protein